MVKRKMKIIISKDGNVLIVNPPVEIIRLFTGERRRVSLILPANPILAFVYLLLRMALKDKGKVLDPLVKKWRIYIRIGKRWFSSKPLSRKEAELRESDLVIRLLSLGHQITTPNLY